MKDYTVDSPSFSDTISIIETTDKVHADKVNAATEQLLANTLVNKTNMDELQKLIMPAGLIVLCINPIDNGLDVTVYVDQ